MEARGAGARPALHRAAPVTRNHVLQSVTSARLRKPQLDGPELRAAADHRRWALRMGAA